MRPPGCRTTRRSGSRPARTLRRSATAAPGSVQGRPVRPDLHLRRQLSRETCAASRPASCSAGSASNVCLSSTCESQVRSRAAELEARRSARTRMALQAVRRQLESLAQIRGRKSLLLLSEGFLQDWSTRASRSRGAHAGVEHGHLFRRRAGPRRLGHAGDTAASFGTSSRIHATRRRWASRSAT